MTKRKRKMMKKKKKKKKNNIKLGFHCESLHLLHRVAVILGVFDR